MKASQKSISSTPSKILIFKKISFHTLSCGIFPNDIVKHRSAEDAAVIFRDAAKLNLTGAGHIWLVTEQALDVTGVPVGALGLQQMHASNEAAHIRDSL